MADQHQQPEEQSEASIQGLTTREAAAMPPPAQAEPSKPIEPNVRMSIGASLEDYILSWPIEAWIKIAVFLLFTGIIYFYLLAKLPETKIQADLHISAIGFTVDSMPGEQSRFNFELSSNGKERFSLDTALMISGPDSMQNYNPLYVQPLDSAAQLKMSKIFVPSSSEMVIDNSTDNKLLLEVSHPPMENGGKYFKWQISIPNSRLYNNATQKWDTVKNLNTDSSEKVFSYSKNLDSGLVYAATFQNPGTWKWPTAILVSSVKFAETGPNGSEAISSVLDGKLNILETNDSAIYFRKGNVFQIEFDKPIELLLHGDSTGIYASFEGIVKQLRAGPKIMGDENNIMPSRIKALNDKSGYVWTILTIIVSIFTISGITIKKKE